MADRQPGQYDALDCQECGACCHGDDGWVHVDRLDDERVERSADLAALVVLTRHGGFVKRSLRMVGGACAGLHRIGARFTCAVYEHRPNVCRDLEVGSAACLGARERALRPSADA